MKSIAPLFALCLGACSFFGKQAPLSPHYYDPEPTARPNPGEEGAGKGLRLGHVRGASHLRERVAYHVSPRELGFYNERRWTERPELYLRRELARELFERRGMTQIVSGLGPTLEVELIDFSEVRGPSHTVSVRARVLLVDVKKVRFERTFPIVMPVQGDGFEGVPEAMGEALGHLVEQIGARVAAELPTTPDPATVPPS